MSEINKSLKQKFHFAKLSLFNMKLLHQIQLSKNDVIIDLVDSEAEANNLTKPVSCLHQASFLSHAYINLVWLWECMKSNNLESKIINEISNNYDISEIKVIQKGDKRKLDKIKDYLRLIRNSISHGNVEVDDDWFIFFDKNPKKLEDYAKIKITWSDLGLLSDLVLSAVNRHLYPDFYKGK